MVPDGQDQDSLELTDQRRRLETLGRLAGNVIHDFNNLLMVIDGYARMMLEDPSLVAGARDGAHEILKASERASILTRQLLAFSRKKNPESTAIELNAQFLKMRPMLSRLLGESVMLECELAREPVCIFASLGQVEQVLINLIVNARDAMPVGGKITVRTRIENARAILEVEDDGAGIPSELQPRIFDPFFTTKPEGKGTGIGLAMVAETVASWGGVVEVFSKEGEGSRFTVTVPLMEASALPIQSGASNSTVLVVEDEDGVRSLLRRVLEQRGYQVLEAASEEGALEQARQLNEIHLLITDVDIKGGDGRNVAEMVRLMHPDIKVLFISGYIQDAPSDHEFSLQKPFSPKTLVLAVQHLLNSN